MPRGALSMVMRSQENLTVSIVAAMQATVMIMCNTRLRMVALFTKKEVQKAGNLIAIVVWGAIMVAGFLNFGLCCVLVVELAKLALDGE